MSTISTIIIRRGVAGADGAAGANGASGAAGATGPAGSDATVTANAVTAVLDDNAASNRTALGLGTAATEDIVQLNVKEAPFNAVGDAVTVTSATIANADNTLTAGTTFTSADIGKTIQIEAGIAGTKQVATIEGAGSITGSGNLTATITSASFPTDSNPIVVTVGVTNGDSLTTWLGKVKTAIENYETRRKITRNFMFAVVGNNLVATSAKAFANDATMGITIAATTGANASLPLSSTITTPGVLRQDLITTIASINSSSSVELTAAPTNTRSGVSITYGTDDTAAIQSALNSSGSIRSIRIPAGKYLLTAPLVLKRSGTSVRGDGKYSTQLEIIDGTKHGFVWDGWQGFMEGGQENQQCDIHSLRLVGRGGDFHSASGIYARLESSDEFFTAISTMSDLAIDSFDTGMWFANWAKNRVSDCRFVNNRISIRLTKSDTFKMSNTGMGASGVAAFSYAFYIEPGGGPTYAGGNFGGIIELGEYGDIDRFIELTGGRVTVIEPNLERIGGAGGCAVHLNGTGGPGIYWHGGRLSQITLTGADASTAALFRVNADSAKGGVVHITGIPQFFNTGWRYVELYGNTPDGVSVKSSDTLKATYTRVNTATAGGASSLTVPIAWEEMKTSAGSYTASTTNRGVAMFKPSDTAGEADYELMPYKTKQNTYKISNRLNDHLIRVWGDSAAPTTNTTTGATTLFTVTIPADTYSSTAQKVKFRAVGTYAANANGKKLVVEMGGVTIYDSTSLAINANDWSIEGIVFRNSTGSISTIVTAASDDALLTNRIQTVKATGKFPNQNLAISVIGTGGATADIELLFAEAYWMKNSSEY